MRTEQRQLAGVAAAGTRPAGTNDLEESGGLGLGRLIKALEAGWQTAGLIGVLTLSAFLNLWHLTQNGYGNSYYAAAARSMTQSWHNFFFASFDPGGFITVDKPPVALWIQAAFARVFGFSGFTILMPQALAGVGAVLLVYLAVSRVFGRTAGLIAGLVLATTPITVAINRSNDLDAWLILFSAAAAYAVIRAIENGSLRWLLLSALLVGVAFNTKTLAGFVALPALWAAYLVVTPVSLKRRIRDLAAATVLLAIVSAAWVAAVDLTPASSRPYVGGSKTNSELNLLIDYNGIGRIDGEGNGPGGGNFAAPPAGGFVPPAGLELPDGALPPNDGSRLPEGALPQGAVPGVDGSQTLPGADGRPADGVGARGGPGGAGFGGGKAGPLRLFNTDLAAQASWLIPLGIFGGVIALLSVGRRLFGNRRLGSIIVWGGWLLCADAVFSEAKGIFHPYYLSFLGPAVGAMAGIATVSMWRSIRDGSRLALLAPLAIAGSAAIEVIFLRLTPSYEGWLTTAVIAGVAIAIPALLATSLRKAHLAFGTAALALALGVLLLPPAFWTKSVLASAGNATLPYVAPAESTRGGFGLGPGNGGGQANTALIDYLKANRDDAKFLVATESSMNAAPIIISTGEPVMAMGGFSGGDPALTVDSLANLVEKGAVRFFLLQGGGLGGRPDDGRTAATGDESRAGGATGTTPRDDAIDSAGVAGRAGRGVSQSVTQACKAVDIAAYGGQTTGAAGSLYDCQGAAEAIRATGGK